MIDGYTPPMALLEAQMIIDRPVDEVFAFVADQTNAPTWQRTLIGVQKLTEGPVGLGTKHSVERRVMGRTTSLANVYTEYVRNEIVGFDVTGPAYGHAVYLTKAVPDGTELISRMELNGRGPFKLLMPFIARSIRREMRDNYVTLKAMLEAKSDTSAPG